MKKIIFTLLFAGVSLIASESTTTTKSSGFIPVDGAAIYQNHCSVCHGKDAKKVPAGASAALAGRDAVRLALTIRSYRDQNKDIGAYTMHKNSEIMLQETSKWSDRQISAIAKYLSGLE